MDHKTLTRQSPVEDPGLENVGPWDLWDRPFVYETEDLDTFLLFLTDEEAREYELSNLTAYSLTLRIEGPDHSSVLYTTSVLKARRDERYALYEALQSYPSRMPRFLREKLSSHVGWFFSLRKFQQPQPAPTLEA